MEGNVGDVVNNIDLAMASNTQKTQEYRTTTITMSYVLTVTTYKKGEFKMPNIDIENYVEEDR
jgi:hypothetical protein